jgi:galactose-1-phosphate uridylyltransferase
MKDPDCLFCKIVAGEIKADIVAESETAIAFRDVSPQAPVHALVIPREHLANLAEVANSSDVEVAELFRLAAEVAELEGVAEEATGWSRTPAPRPTRRSSTLTSTSSAAVPCSGPPAKPQPVST